MSYDDEVVDKWVINVIVVYVKKRNNHKRECMYAKRLLIYNTPASAIIYIYFVTDSLK